MATISVPAGGRPAAGSRASWASGVGVVLLTASLVAASASWSQGPLRDALAVGAWQVVTAVTAGLLVARVARNPVGWLLAAVAVCTALQGAALAVATQVGGGTVFTVAAWLSHWVALPGFGAFGAIALLFPTGRLPSPRWRPVAGILGGGLLALTVLTAVTPAPVGGLGVDNPLAWHSAAGALRALLQAAPVVVMVGALGAVASLVARVRRSRDDERQQLRWFLSAVVVLVACLLFAGVASGPLNELSFVLALVGLTSVPVAIGIAILEYHLYDLDRVINRAIVYASLSLVVVGVYVATVAVLAVAFDRALGLAASLAATAAVAVAFQPMRTRLQRAVDRLVYGQRNDAAAALTTLAQQLHDAPDPTTVPQQLVATVSTALKCPYVAVELDLGDGSRTTVASGADGSQVESIPIRWHGEELGSLLIGDAQLRGRDRELLADLVRQAAPALAAVRLTSALERSRQQLVVAREEERRRLRGDLHDGLGPQLAGLAMGLDAVGNLLDSDPGAARAGVARLRERSQQALATVRAVCRGLRPPVLDDLGLVNALRQEGLTLAASGCRLTVTAEGDLDRLPAAVEVAAYHICLEAMTNAVRHADPSHIAVRLSHRGPELLLEISDDGRGIPADHPFGVGLPSMRQRAQELRGTLTVETAPPRGTTVRATVPVGAP